MDGWSHGLTGQDRMPEHHACNDTAPFFTVLFYIARFGGNVHPTAVGVAPPQSIVKALPHDLPHDLQYAQVSFFYRHSSTLDPLISTINAGVFDHARTTKTSNTPVLIDAVQSSPAPPDGVIAVRPVSSDISN